MAISSFNAVAGSNTAVMTKTYVYESSSFTLPANTPLIQIGLLDTLTNGVVNSSNIISATINFRGTAVVHLFNGAENAIYMYAIAPPTSAVTAPIRIVFFYK